MTVVVSPAVLAAFEKGRVLADAIPGEELVRSSARTLLVFERRLARLIRDQTSAGPAAVAA
jgi:hypothetical protein